jgi:hypothetical protein
MNPLNYASLEASKRLSEVGIVLLFVDKAWIHDKWDDTWVLGVVTPTIEARKERWEFYMAPSMAEAWRELPEWRYDKRKTLIGIEGLACAGYTNWESRFTSGESFTSNNPTDALINLLIWVKKEKADGQK